ncbi:MAG: rRNA pseudouridine synthase [Bdellovibrionaceae bacterium]|nr:rRNA pseudouridine synthase [Pseudobdellovibrionaceae bacterium]NUM59532.1 rRNA pseudouridine synthase [Pseudobdellovibrionaceae bacterium]
MSEHSTPKAKNAATESRVRLNKFLAESGVCSRRAADRIIAEGKVLVNGKKVFELGIKVSPTDRITVEGKPLKLETEKVYLMFHKPKGVLTTLTDPENRPTIGDYVARLPQRVFPVGRLDWDSEGLILLTNDGEWANKIMQPSSEVTKTYLVKLNGKPEVSHFEKLRRGFSIPGGRVKALHIEKIRRKDGSSQYDWIKIVIDEGKNRQIRFMFEKVGFDVLKLQRIGIGKLRLGNLEKGELQFLTAVEKKKVFQTEAPESSNMSRVKKSASSKSTNPYKKNQSKFGNKKAGPKSKKYQIKASSDKDIFLD